MKFPLFSLVLLCLNFWSCFGQVQENLVPTYFNKSYSCDSLNQNAIAVLSHHQHFLVAGLYQGFDDYTAFYVRALDKNGEILWEKILDEGQTERNLSGGDSFIATKDGNFVLIASKKLPISNLNQRESQAIVFIKFDEQGEVIWNKTLHQDNLQSARQIAETSDGGFIVVGYQKLEGEETHAYLSKLNDRGDLEWEKQLKLGSKSVALSVEITPKNEILISGYQINQETRTDMFVSKLSDRGEVVWTKHYGTNEHDTGATIKLLPNGDFLMAGAIREQNVKKLYISRVDANGEIVWSKTHALPQIANIQTTLQLLENEHFAGIAYFHNDYGKTAPIALFFDENGNLKNQQVIEGQSESHTYIKDMERTVDGGFVLAGYNYSEQNSWILKTDANAYACEILNCLREGSGEELLTDISDTAFENTFFFQILPNRIVSQAAMIYQLPVSEQLAEVYIYNQMGQMVQQISLQQNEGKMLLDGKDFEAGMYVCQLMLKGEIAGMGRFIVR